jgi:hypothetical protein
MMVVARDGIQLLPEVTCPNCWRKFPPEAALAIAGHLDLAGDPLLEDPDEPRRFLPTRFSPECAPLDERDSACMDYACPHCHLVVPQVLFERRPTLFLSIFGRASSGKSYFLTSMAHQLQTILPQRFGLAVTEPHTPSNRLLREYKNALFNHPNPDAMVFLPKTEKEGAKWYSRVRDGDNVRQYPRPLFFQVAPTGRHPGAVAPSRSTRTVCLYDNAGEHFEPGHASPSSPETEHLARSSALLFVFDPTQEPRFIAECRGNSTDPQFDQAAADRPVEHVIDPQDVILATVDQLVKKARGRELAQPIDMPLVVVIAKYDAWAHMVKGGLPPYAASSGEDSLPFHGFRAAEVEAVSERLRELLVRLCPAIVTAAERFCRTVCYIPTSATGCPPSVVGFSDPPPPETPKPIYRFRKSAIAPMWAEVPLLWILSRLTTGLLPVAQSTESG